MAWGSLRQRVNGTSMGNFPCITWKPRNYFPGTNSIGVYNNRSSVFTFLVPQYFCASPWTRRRWKMAGLDDAQLWQLYVKDMVGATTTVSVHNPQVSRDYMYIYLCGSVHLPTVIALNIRMWTFVAFNVYRIWPYSNWRSSFMNRDLTSHRTNRSSSVVAAVLGRWKTSANLPPFLAYRTEVSSTSLYKSPGSYICRQQTANYIQSKYPPVTQM